MVGKTLRERRALRNEKRNGLCPAKEKKNHRQLDACDNEAVAIDRTYFSQCNRPLYLASMAVAPDLQRQGIGRLCVEAAAKLVKQWPGDAIRLDAYDAVAGAGEFYRKCGFREVGRASYRNVPLIYFEMLV